MRLFAGLVLAVLLCAACQNQSSSFEPGRTTLMDVVSRLGQPSRIWPEADGGLLVEFSRAAQGGSNFMGRFAADGRLRSLQDVLTDARVAMLEAGMSRDEVRRHLGQPARVDDPGGSEVWHWPLDDRRPARWQIDAHFGARGKLESVERTRIEPLVLDAARAQTGQRTGSLL